jgi:hypothetical protein
MIIQINATVCAAVDHGEGIGVKIAGTDQGEGHEKREMGPLTRKIRN